MNDTLVPLPDGVDEAALMRFGELIVSNPEKAAALADLAVKSHQARARQAWCLTAQVLYVVEHKELWRHHPAGFTSFDEWCAQPEVDIVGSTRSDMHAVATHAATLSEHGIDIWQTIVEVGIAKVRRIIPTMKEAVRDDLVEELLVPLLGQLQGSTWRDVLAMVEPKNKRLTFMPTATYIENADGTFTLALEGLDLDQLEAASQKLGLRKWRNGDGQDIPSPLALPG